MSNALIDLVDELKRRRVFGAVIGYAVVTWVILQLASVVYQPLGAPPWAMTWTVLIAALGFPIVGTLAWSFDITREGIKRTRNLPGSSSRSRLVPLLVVMVGVSALGYALWGIYRPAAGTDAGGAGRVTATERYLEGRQLWANRTPRDLERARQSFELSIKADPSYALAYTGLADTLLLQVDYDQGSLLKAVEAAEPLIHQAIKLNAQLSEAFASFGLLKRSVGQLSGAESMFRQALKLDDKNLNALIWLGGLLGQQGRLIEQREMLERAYALDRFSPLAALNRAINRKQLGEDTQAHEILREAATVNGSNELIERMQIKIYLDAGNLAAAYPLSVKLFSANPMDSLNAQLLVTSAVALGAFENAALLTREGMKRVKMSAANEANVQTFLSVLEYARTGTVPSAEAEPSSKDPAIDAKMSVLAMTLAGRNVQALERLQPLLEGDLYATIDGISITLTAAELERRLKNQEAYLKRLQRAEQLLDRAAQQGAKERQLSLLRAAALGMRNNVSDAMAQLQAAHLNADVDLLWLATDPTLASIRQAPEFIAWSEAAKQRTSALRQRLKADAFDFSAAAALAQTE